METVIKSEQICDVEVVVDKKQRGRPRKYPLFDPQEKVDKKRGRPRKFPLEEKPPKKSIGRPLGSIKEGYRTADDKKYFNNYYNNKLKDIYVVCEKCGKTYQKCRQHRHLRSKFCMDAQSTNHV